MSFGHFFFWCALFVVIGIMRLGEEDEWDTSFGSGLFFLFITVALPLSIIPVAAERRNRSPKFWYWVAAFTIFLSPWFAVLILWFLKGHKCTWCGAQKLKFAEGREGKKFWKHSNKNGSRDHRFKDNSEISNFISTWECESCGAKTNMIHAATSRPSQKNRIIEAEYRGGGTGERSGSDWQLQD